MTLKVPDICAWFQLQQGAARLETIVNLLQMLYPLELQFVGAYLEDLARRDYHCLRDVEHRFNIPEIVARLTDVNDGRCRASLIVALSLLKSSNQKTAATVHNILLSFHVVYRQLPKTKDVYEEILLLLTMAKHHPAFKFDQKTSVACLLEEIDHFLQQNEHHESINDQDSPDPSSSTCDQLLTSHLRKFSCDCANASTQTSVDDYEMVGECANLSTGVEINEPEVDPCPTASSDSNSPDLKASDVFVTHVKVKGSQRSGNTHEFTIEASWSNGEVTDIVKTQEDLYEFHRKLLDLFPSDAGCYGYNRRIPYFPGYRHSPEQDVAVSPEVIQLVFHYIQDFLAVNEDILASRYAANFFKSSTTMDGNVRLTSCSSDTGSSYCLNMLFEPNSRPPTSYKQQSSNDTGSNEDDQDFVDDEGRLKSFVYYNSHISPSPKSRSDRTTTSPKSTIAESSTSCSLTSKTATDSSQYTLAGGDVSSTSRVVPLPPCSTAPSPRTKESSCDGSRTYPSPHPLVFVPKPLYFILRAENLLEMKKYFVNFKIDELLNINSETDVDEKLDIPAKDKKEVLRVLNLLKQVVLGVPLVKNGFVDKRGDKRFAYPPYSQRKMDNWDLEHADFNSIDRSHARAPSTSSVDTNDNGPIRVVNGEIGDSYHSSDSNFIARSNSTSAVASASPSNKSNRPKSFHHRHHSKNQLRKYSIPLNVERYGSVDDNNILSDSSCVSETPLMLHNNEDEYPHVAGVVQSFFGVSPLPSEAGTGRGRPITKMSNSLPPSKSQSPVPNDLSPGMGIFQTMCTSFGQQRKAMTPGVVFPPSTLSFGRGINKPQPIRCLYPTNVVDSAQNHGPVLTNHFNYQAPSLPPPSAVAYDMSRSNVPMFSLPPPGSGFGFIRGPPPMTILSCQCNGTGSCQVCVAGRWNAANGGTMFVQFGPHPSTLVPPPPPPNATSPSTTFVCNNFQVPNEAIGANPGAQYATSSTRISLTLDLPSADQVFCGLTSNPGGVETFGDVKFVSEREFFCSNCGSNGHSAENCIEATLDDITSAGQYHLNLRSVDEASTVPAQLPQQATR